MKTKVVYVVISSEKDIFLEELWVSAFSLRHYNPDARVEVLTDEPTAIRIKKNEELYSLLSELKIVEVPKDFNSKEKSRILKTNVRNHVDGDYLYIDTDTVICGSLDEIDNTTADIGCVADGHVTLQESMFRPYTLGTVKRIFDIDASDYPVWYNAGVMYVKDNELTHRFFSKWCENWKYSTFVKGCSQDMPAMLFTDIEFGRIVKSIPDDFNAQIALSMKYFHTAKILHFWHMDFLTDQSFSPFMSGSIYKEIKKNGRLSSGNIGLILNCKSSFFNPTTVIGKAQISFLFSVTGQVFTRIHQHSRRGAAILDYIASRLNLFYRAKRKMKRLLQQKGKTSVCEVSPNRLHRL